MRILLCVGVLLSSCEASPEPAAPKTDDGRVEALERRLAQAEARIDVLEKRVVPPAPTKPASDRVSITLSPSQTFVDQEAVAQVALRAHLEAVLAESPGASVVIQADPTVDHQRVVETMKVIRESGFARISIATRSEE